MRGITSSVYIVGIVSDRTGGDLGTAIVSINFNAPIIVVLLLIVLTRINRDEANMLSRARTGGEPV